MASTLVPGTTKISDTTRRRTSRQAAVTIFGTIFGMVLLGVAAVPAAADSNSSGGQAHCGTVTADETWSAPDQNLNCKVTIAPGATVTLSPGVSLTIKQQGTITVSGALVGVGQPGHPITVKGNGNLSRGNIRLDGGSVWIHGANIDKMPVSGDGAQLVLSGSTLTASRIEVGNVNHAVVESNMFERTPLDFQGTQAPVVGANTFNQDSDAAFSVTGAADLSGLGANTSSATITVNTSRAGPNFVMAAGQWALAGLTVPAGDLMTIQAGTTAGLAGTLHVDGVVQSSNAAGTSPVTLRSTPPTPTGTKATVDVGASGLLFANNVALASIATTGAGRQVILNSTAEDSLLSTTGSSWGPIFAANRLTRTPIRVTGGTPSVAANTFTGYSGGDQPPGPLLWVTAAEDLSGVGSNTFDPDVGDAGRTVTASQSRVRGTWNVTPGQWSFDGVTVEPTGVVTAAPGAAMTVTSAGFDVNGTFQAQRNSDDQPILLHGTGATPVRVGGTMFVAAVRTGDVNITNFTDTSGTAPNPGAYLAIIASEVSNTTVTISGVARGPVIVNNTFAHVTLDVTGAPNADISGNSGT